MARSLRHLLQSFRAGGETTELSLLLQFPYCVPTEPGLLAKAQRVLGRVPNPTLEPGMMLLAATTGTEGSLWLLAPAANADATTQLDRACQQQLRFAGRQVSRALPIIGAPPEAEWSVVSIVGGRVSTLSGSSFGLSFHLAAASLMLQVPLPADVVASAETRSDGSVKGVDAEGLRHKITALIHWAPAVTRLLVSEEQRELAGELLEELGGDIRVVGVDSVASAVHEAFVDVDLIEQAAHGWGDPRRRRWVIQHLFEQALNNTAPLLKFEGIARACELLSNRFSPEGEDAHRLEFARLVARGHDGGEDTLPWRPQWLEWVERQQRSRRLELVAHFVERSVYAPTDERTQILVYAKSLLPRSPLEDCVGEFKVSGALGRALAPLGEYDEAVVYLERAARGWKADAAWGSSSYCLCELTRIRGLMGDAEELEALLQGSVQEAFASQALNDISRAFMVFAVGRAWAQLGEFEKAAGWLDHQARSHDVDWDRTPPHLQASVLRWEAQAAAGRGNQALAEQCRKRLQSLAEAEPDDAEFAWVLCQLDALLEAHAAEPAICSALERFGQVEPKALELALRFAASDAPRDRARALIRHYPY